MGKLTREEVERIVKEAPGRGELPNLREVDLSNMDLSEADLSVANLFGANLSEVNLRKANLTGVDLIGADLSRADLSEANLTSAIFSSANLTEANLSRANLTSANLLGAILIEANLSEADLYKADLSFSALFGVDFTKANLSWTDLTGSFLIGTDLSEAQVWGTKFGDIDLSEVLGLDTVKHSGPSNIDTHTFIRSQGKIPEIFLRGCGLSDLQIEMAKLYNPDLTSEQVANISDRIRELYVASPVQYYSCFISYSHKDEAFAQRLHADLQQKGVRCWFAPEDMKIGDRIRPRIDESIRIHDKLLLVLSEYSVASQWVEHEVEHALDLERERAAPVLFPIRLDDAVMESKVGWAGNTRRTRHIGDFSRWKDHDAYQEAFERLLRDLKAEN
jgi:uncharacterized protein YjbI with pentapeptide repeats